MNEQNPPLKSDYIDHDGHAEQIENYIELTKKGAVIGITGVRGAGKSALMDELCEQVSHKYPDYYVCKMTAPASYEQPMAFLRTVCLNLCHTVRVEAEDVLHSNKNQYLVEEKKAQRRRWWFSENRLLILVMMLLLLISNLWGLLDGVKSYNSIEEEAYLQHITKIQIDDKQNKTKAVTELELKTKSQRQFIDSIKEGEQNALSDLVMQINRLLFLTHDSTSFHTSEMSKKLANLALKDEQTYQLTWGIDGVGFSLLPSNVKSRSNPNISAAIKAVNGLTTADIEKGFNGVIELTNAQSNTFETALWPYVRFVLKDGTTPEFKSNEVYDAEQVKQLMPSKPINWLTLLYSRDTVKSFERHLLKGNHGTQAKIQLKPLAKQLRALLQAGIVNGRSNQTKQAEQIEIHIGINDDGRPTHILPSWIVSEALINGQLQFTATQLLQLKQLLIDYQPLLNAVYKPIDLDDWLLKPSELFLLFWLIVILVAFFLIVKKSRLYADAGAGAVAAAGAAGAAAAVAAVAAVAVAVAAVAVAAVLLALILRLILTREKVLTLLKLNPEHTYAKAQLNATKQFEDELNYHTDIQANGEVGYKGFKKGQSQNKQKRELNLPLLTSKFENYCQQLLNAAGSDNSKVIIAIDELDKIHDIAQVKHLLSDIKGVLSLPNCYFILTISEDCAESFQQRLAKGRDIFESSFDEMFYVERVERDVASRLGDIVRNSKYKRLPIFHETIVPQPYFYHLTFLFSGGVAREINRTLKQLYSGKADPIMFKESLLISVLLQQAWQEWLREMLNLPIKGEQIKLMHELAEQAVMVLTKEITIASLLKVDECIATSISALHTSEINDVIWSDKQTHIDEKAEKVYHKAVEQFSGIRTLVKLEILTKMSKRWLDDEPWTDEHDHRVIESFRLLEKQPLLARKLVCEW